MVDIATRKVALAGAWVLERASPAGSDFDVMLCTRMDFGRCDAALVLLQRLALEYQADGGRQLGSRLRLDVRRLPTPIVKVLVEVAEVVLELAQVAESPGES